MFNSYNYILLRQLVITDFKLRYQNSALGYLWSLMRPLGFFGIIYIVFVKVLPVGNSLPNFGIYLLLGIVIWEFFSEATNMSVQVIVNRGDLIRKIKLPRYTIVLATMTTSFINLLLNLIVVFIFAIIGGIRPDLNWFFLILLFTELYLFTLGISFFLSSTFVKNRDLSHIWEIVLRAGFYFTPILYDFRLVKSHKIISKIMAVNPLAQIIQDIRFVAITDQSLTLSKLTNSYYYGLSFAFVILTFLIGVWVFNKKSVDFAEYI